MPDAPTVDPIPADAGLKPGKQEQQKRSTDELIDAAAGGARLSPEEDDDLVSYYLSNGELPGDSQVKPLSVNLGDGRDARTFRCEVHAIEWSEWQDARERATNAKSGEFDAFVSSSWVVARALVKPKLGPSVVQLQKTNPDDAPQHAADLLQRMFRRQSGALLELSGMVLDLSKLQNDSNSVKEIEAAKN